MIDKRLASKLWLGLSILVHNKTGRLTNLFPTDNRCNLVIALLGRLSSQMQTVFETGEQ